jgi:hypothetical protein
MLSAEQGSGEGHLDEGAGDLARWRVDCLVEMLAERRRGDRLRALA